MDPAIAAFVVTAAVLIAVCAFLFLGQPDSRPERHRLNPIPAVLPSENATPSIDHLEGLAHFEVKGEPIDEQFQGESGAYIINLVNQTCTCPDWQVVRRGFPYGHFRRICKHLAAAMTSHFPDGSIWKVVFSEIKFGLQPADHFCFMRLNNGHQVFFFRHGDREWCDVIAAEPKSTRFELFGFGLVHDRWS